jgi:hypothetical protein
MVFYIKRVKLLEGWDVAQVVYYLPSKCKTLSSNLSTTKRKKKKKDVNLPEYIIKLTLFCILLWE